MPAGRPRSRPPDTPSCGRSRPANAVKSFSPLVLHDDSVYTLSQLGELLGLTSSSLDNERKKGRLRAYHRCDRWFTTGRDVKQWLEGGVKPDTAHGDREPAHPVNHEM